MSCTVYCTAMDVAMIWPWAPPHIREGNGRADYRFILPSHRYCPICPHRFNYTSFCRGSLSRDVRICSRLIVVNPANDKRTVGFATVDQLKSFGKQNAVSLFLLPFLVGAVLSELGVPKCFRLLRDTWMLRLGARYYLTR